MDTEDGDEEVTFLLRLKPAPTPPVRRRRPLEDRQTVPKGWDVVIEREPPPVPPRVQPSAPPPELMTWHPKPPFYYPPYQDYRNLYAESRNSGGGDLISPPHAMPPNGFHVNAGKPPVPQPRMTKEKDANMVIFQTG